MIFVTGGAGYVGSHITKQLVREGKQVRVLVRDREYAQKEGRLQELDVEMVEGDVTNPLNLTTALEGVMAVIHTVAIAIEKKNATYEEVNYQGTVNMVEAARDAGVSRFINLSQLGAQADLPYRFMASKGMAQDYVAASELNWTAFRPAVIWGPEDEFANTFAKLTPFTPLVYPIVDKEAKFQSVWVKDVAASIVKSINDPETFHKEYELGGPEVLTLEEIERRTLTAVGAKRKFFTMPKSVLNPLVTLMEKLLPNPPVTRNLLELLQVSNVCENNTITKFVQEPKPFTPQNIAPYMRQFSARDTLGKFFES